MTDKTNAKLQITPRIAIVASCYNAHIVNHLIANAALTLVGPKYFSDIPERKNFSEFDTSDAYLIEVARNEKVQCGVIYPDLHKPFVKFARTRNDTPNDISDDDVVDIYFVPGAFEIPQAARMIASRGLCDGIVALGCVIRGETAHFDAVGDACTEGLARIAQDFTMPVGHGVLLVKNEEQAIERCAPHGQALKRNTGNEAAQAVLDMLELQADIDERAKHSK